jgi:hypothetical protein
MGLKLLDPANVSKVLNYPCRYSGVLIPYPGEDYLRVRLLDCAERKYSSPLNSGCGPLYLPPLSTQGSVPLDWSDIKVDTGVPIVITEGEVKSYWGCKTGAVVIGLGGVDMQAKLVDGNWRWSGRLVNICFDHDAGQEPGQYKPGVANALGRLCSLMIEQGAVVNVIHVGQVASAAGVVGKCGLDDYLRAGGKWPALLATAAPAPEWCEMLSAMLDECVYVVGTNHTHVFNLVNKSRKAPADFHDAHVEKKRIVVGEGGKGRVRQISNIWMEHPGRLTVDGYDLNPRLSYGVQGRVINLWEGYPNWRLGSAERTAEVMAEWQRFMEGLFGEHWAWVGLWAGHILNRPWERSTQAVMVLSMVQGLGKSLFGDILKDLCGKHGLEGRSSRMFSGFNAEQEAKTFVMVNELDVKFSAREGQLNDLLTAEVVEIEQKGKDVISLPNLRRWYFTTNTSSPCRLSRGQRRILVVTPPRLMADTRGEWGDWVREVVAKFRKSEADLAAIRKWFDDLWYGDRVDSGELAARGLAGDGEWDATAQVPITQEALDAAEASMTTMQITAEHILEWIRERDGGWAAVHPDLRKRDVKMFGDLTALVKAHGGYVGQKTIKEDGVVKAYTIYDTCGKLDRLVQPSSGKHVMVVESDEARARAIGLAAEYVKITEILTGKG